MIPKFDIHQYTPAFVAVRALDKEAQEWLSHITSEHKDYSILEALLSVMKTRGSLRPTKVLQSDELQDRMTLLYCQLPQGTVETIEDLVRKKLLPSSGALPRNLILDPVTGQHSFVFGRMFEDGVSIVTVRRLLHCLAS